MFKPILKARARINRYLFSEKNHLPNRSLKPLSSRFGFDRGAPIDRFWIEAFLEKNKKYIKGSVLEITDPTYTKRFGGNKVKRSDVLDIDPGNRLANIKGDLRNLRDVIKDNTYDCIILTHVLGLIDDYTSVASEMKRILKPRGVLLFTGSCLGPILGEKVFWRFTPNSVKHIFSKEFKSKNIDIHTFGNVLTCQAFLTGMAQEELTAKELNYNDPRFPCVVTARIIK